MKTKKGRAHGVSTVERMLGRGGRPMQLIGPMEGSLIVICACGVEFSDPWWPRAIGLYARHFKGYKQ